jgi:ribosomal protein S27E
MHETKQPITDALQTKCKSCGGIMQYSPADEDLKCVYCGYISGLDLTAAEIKENDFNHWKDRAEENSEGQTVEVTEIKCRQCGANTTLAPNISAAKCVFCSTPLILNEASIKRFWQPEYLLPFKITEKESGANFKKWLGKKWFLPSELKKGGVNTDMFKGVYLPFWTYDANTFTEYTGERGDDRTESYRNNKGEEVRRTITDWYPTSGTVSVPFDDIVVPAAETLPPKIMNGLTNWDMMNCVAYRPVFMAGFITELYQIDFRDGVQKAKEKMDKVIDSMIRSDIGGNHQKIRSKHTQYNDLMFKLLLLPIWISAFKFNGKLYQFVVNGRTGQVIGEYPKSTTKIVMLVVAIIAVIAALVMIL